MGVSSFDINQHREERQRQRGEATDFAQRRRAAEMKTQTGTGGWQEIE